MEFAWSAEEEQYRVDILGFLEAEVPAEIVESAHEIASKWRADFSKQFAAKLAGRHWLTPSWPRAYGGMETTAWQQMILAELMVQFGEPRGNQYMNVNWIGPAVILAGTPEQKAYHLSRISRGDVLWCQGFSEPEAGSDLASMRTRAERDGDEYVVNGEKIWTSYANIAEFCFLLVRTDPGAEQHRGISILLVPMDTQGLEVRDLGCFVGEHSIHQLVFTDMQIPVSARLGPENEGWPIVRQALGLRARRHPAVRALGRQPGPGAAASQCPRHPRPWPLAPGRPGQGSLRGRQGPRLTGSSTSGPRPGARPEHQHRARRHHLGGAAGRIGRHQCSLA